VEKVAKPRDPPVRRIGRAPHELHREAALEAVFVKVPRLLDFKRREEGLGFLLDLAMERIACDTALALLVEDTAFAFKAGRGLKAEETLRAGISIPLGDGIVGFCGQELVCLAVSDVEKDPRFFRRIHEELRYPTRSMLVCPIVKQGRVFGALQLKNKKDGAFDEGDLAVLSYLAHHAAGYLERRELEAPFAAVPPPPRAKRA
jgi:GAF domain-containing protein